MGAYKKSSTNIDPINVKYQYLLYKPWSYSYFWTNLGPTFLFAYFLYFWTNLGPVLVTGPTYCRTYYTPQNSKACFLIGLTITFYYQ